MKILLMSDVHGDYKSLEKVLNREKNNFDKVVFTGDGTREFKEVFKDENTIEVRGNCDLGSENEEEYIELENNKILITHGHLYDVKRDLNNLYYRGKEVGADYIFFGHTHIPTNEVIDDIKMINGGSLSEEYCVIENTYCIIDLNCGDVVFRRV